ncbi:hypothetical protein OIE66_02740 [Nonomuraea sp. NBC_01738]|uniref:hypothetical protein n=1 Tax=Nonomuraea sp. NBC_01738 TaxID=2976003 RepID=UPI002E1425A9|nr:hypothetical protein OIE66_02740 [Nonomuraea sp. NBC_01738]
MQTSRPADDLRLAFYCTDPDSVPGEDCATFYRTNRGTWIVQGDRRDEPHVVAQLVALKPSETSVEIPEPLVELLVRSYAKERYGIDLG